MRTARLGYFNHNTIELISTMKQNNSMMPDGRKTCRHGRELNLIVLFVSIVSLALTSYDLFGQQYTRFYSDDYIIAKIEQQGYKTQHGTNSEHLYIRLKSQTPVTVSGYIKVRFIDFADGTKYYTEQYFSNYVTMAKYCINDYYHPTTHIGDYETLEFYIDSVVPDQAVNEDTSDTDCQIQSEPAEFVSMLKMHYAVCQDAYLYRLNEYNQFVLYYKDGRCFYYEKGTVLCGDVSLVDVDGTSYLEIAAFPDVKEPFYVKKSCLKCVDESIKNGDPIRRYSR